MNHNTQNSNYPLLKELSKLLGKKITFVDLETTSLLNFSEDQFGIVEIALIHITEHGVVRKTSLIDPRRKIPAKSTQITGITQEDVRGKPAFDHFAKYVKNFLTQDLVMGFNSKTFDIPGLIVELNRTEHSGVTKDSVAQLDVRDMYLIDKRSRGLTDSSGTLVNSAKEHGVVLEGNAHRASYDIELTAMVAHKLIEKHGVQWAVDIFNKKISSKVVKPKTQSNWGQKTTVSEGAIVQRIVSECKIMTDGQRLDIESLKAQIGCSDKEMSFAISSVLTSYEFDSHFTDPAAQVFLSLHLPQAMKESGWGGKLKPLLNHINRIQSPMSSSKMPALDYTQLRIALKKVQNNSSKNQFKF